MSQMTFGNLGIPTPLTFGGIYECSSSREYLRILLCLEIQKFRNSSDRNYLNSSKDTGPKFTFQTRYEKSKNHEYAPKTYIKIMKIIKIKPNYMVGSGPT